ncbi:hypothetical protein K432DRAFT_441121 [Lepidopterella palustris CBS 459.81]|uniref:Aminoglycoside phosphotransferase domain-containing protein n=1 Tax=Lepidopterella palustris CBS 459.81 TaxID=1314670 RepID=A0A8E2EGF7_9PEZI|nr:hypothetical protein K432DRAFT_441121 [Lepidopterella palustris CBS 459.81]
MAVSDIASITQQQAVILEEGGIAGQENIERTQESLHDRPPMEAVIDRIVSPNSFRLNNGAHDVPRGPFKSSRYWLKNKASRHETDGNFAKSTSLITTTSKKNGIIPRRSNSHNILIDDNGVLTAVVDWELAYVVPLYQECQPPQFPEGTEQMQKPEREHDGQDEEWDADFLEYMRQYEHITGIRYFWKIWTGGNGADLPATVQSVQHIPGQSRFRVRCSNVRLLILYQTDEYEAGQDEQGRRGCENGFCKDRSQGEQENGGL